MPKRLIVKENPTITWIPVETTQVGNNPVTGRCGSSNKSYINMSRKCLKLNSPWLVKELFHFSDLILTGIGLMCVWVGGPCGHVCMHTHTWWFQFKIAASTGWLGGCVGSGWTTCMHTQTQAKHSTFKCKWLPQQGGCLSGPLKHTCMHTCQTCKFQFQTAASTGCGWMDGCKWLFLLGVKMVEWVGGCVVLWVGDPYMHA